MLASVGALAGGILILVVVVGGAFGAAMAGREHGRNRELLSDELRRRQREWRH
jgi:hypothetical protein